MSGLGPRPIDAADDHDAAYGMNTVSLDNDDDPIMNSPLSFVRGFNFPLYLLFWNMLTLIWDTIYYVTWARFNDNVLNGKPSSKLILAMVIIAHVAFWPFVGPFLLYAVKYAGDKKKRNWATKVALVIVFLLCEMPSFIIHFTILQNIGFVSQVQGIAAVLRVVSGFGTAYLVWHIYMSAMTKFLTANVWSPADELREMQKKREKDRTMRQRKGLPVYR